MHSQIICKHGYYCIHINLIKDIFLYNKYPVVYTLTLTGSTLEYHQRKQLQYT